MQFRRHSELADRHASFAPSSPAWIRYDDDKVIRTFKSKLQKIRGTREHAWARETIELGFKMADSPRTMNLYINHCIGFRLTPEVPLYYSDHCFGHADALGFRSNKLRVFDYKSGVNPTTFEQLMIYVALFCLEYEQDPFKIEMELRIYQHNTFKTLVPDAEDIRFMMERIKTVTRIAEELIESELG